MEVVNGYVCNNCTDVEKAKKGVDPARPKDGPNGADKVEEAKPSDRGPAVTFGGEVTGAQGVENVRPAGYVPGSSLNLTA